MVTPLGRRAGCGRHVATLLWAGAMLLTAPPTPAATHLIRPDGTGDFPTIQAGLDGMADGDTLLLADGVFSGIGNRDLQAPLAIIHAQHADPTRCAVDLGGFPLGDITYGCEFRNIEFRDGGKLNADYYAIVMFSGCRFVNPSGVASAMESHLTLADCEIVGGNSGSYGLGSGESVELVRCQVSEHQGTYLFKGFNLDASDCIFERNTCTANLLLGDPWMDMSPGLDVEHCRFYDNAAGEGMLHSRYGFLHAVECTFARNVGSSVMALVWDGSYDIPTRIERCTLAENQGASEITLVREYGSDTSIDLLLDHSILAFREGGYAVACIGEDIVTAASCCDIFGNEGGDWVDCIAEHYGINGNISLDPRFCGGTDGYRLQEDSPGAPGATCAERMGAWPVGCPSDVPPASDVGGAPLLVLRPSPSLGRVCFQGSVAGEALTIEIFDTAGRGVRVLHGNGGVEQRTLTWDGRRADGSAAPAGAYLYRARSITREQRGHIILAR